VYIVAHTACTTSVHCTLLHTAKHEAHTPVGLLTKDTANFLLFSLAQPLNKEDSPLHYTNILKEIKMLFHFYFLHVLFLNLLLFFYYCVYHNPSIERGHNFGPSIRLNSILLLRGHHITLKLNCKPKFKSVSWELSSSYKKHNFYWVGQHWKNSPYFCGKLQQKFFGSESQMSVKQISHIDLFVRKFKKNVFLWITWLIYRLANDFMCYK